MTQRAEKLNIKKPVLKLLSSISDKNREVLERRFGIGRNNAETLESIGRSYEITRERVRQIQEYGFKKLVNTGANSLLAPAFLKIENYINKKGGVVKESDIFETLVTSEEAAHLSFVLRLMPGLIVRKETDDLHTRYALNEAVLRDAETLVSSTHLALAAKKTPISFAELMTLAPENIVSLSRRIKQGFFGDWGLADWSRITPRGVKDKAHLVFEQEKRPLHFREISELIDKYFVLSHEGAARPRLTHPQTVHNELIKDPRFVLIGRGLYALSDWGYEPGTVKDVLVQILKDAGEALDKEDVLRLISERRFVKPNTVFLNLQNKNYFKKLQDGKYYLA
ncbi:MAG: sigma factor-like helix-turn-helix DNA-binding protein [Candidatus Spechtbacterales bacterium]